MKRLISDKINGLKVKEQDFNEIETCAVEICAAKIIGWNLLPEKVLLSNLSSSTTVSSAVEQIYTLKNTEQYYHLSKEVLDAIVITANSFRAI